MRWLAIVIAVAAVIGLGIDNAAIAESAAQVSLESITFNSQSPTLEDISFTLSSAVQPKIFAIPGDNPRLVLDFPETLYKGDSVMPLYNSNLAVRIRTGLHSKPSVKTRVVIDLTKTGPVQHRAKYLAQGLTLVVTLSKQTQDEPEVSEGKKQPQDEPQIAESKAKVTPEESSAVTEQVPPETDESEPPVPVVTEKKNDQSQAASSAEIAGPSAALPLLLDISFDDSSNRGEMVLFHLNDFYPPTVSAIEKENPRVLCDFNNMNLADGVQEDIVAGGKFVKHIRAEKSKNPDKVRIVLDLSPERDYDLQQVFFKNDNLFVLIVNELPAK